MAYAFAYKSEMTDAQIIDARGGIRPVARKLGHRNHTTVQGWRDRSRIPLEHVSAVLALPLVRPTDQQSAA